MPEALWVVVSWNRFGHQGGCSPPWFASLLVTLYVILVRIMVSHLSGCWLRSTSLPGGHQVDGLPPAPSASHHLISKSQDLQSNSVPAHSRTLVGRNTIPRMSKCFPKEEIHQHNAFIKCKTIKRGALILRMRRRAKHSPDMRTPEIHQKSSKINDLENEPGHVWRLPMVSGVTRDDI